jgi:hypothetical protein
MVRPASFVLLVSALSLMAQTSTQILDRTPFRQTICGPIGVKAWILDTSQDRAAEPHQSVGITLKNLTSTRIDLERITLHFAGETPTSGAPFETQSRVEVGARHEAFFAQSTTVPNPVSYVEVNLVKYADGSSWQPNEGEVCKIVPEPLQSQASGTR